MDTLRRIGSAPKIIILRMRRVPLLDASGVTAMGDIVDHAEVLGIRVILSGVTAQPMEMLERVSLGPSSSRVLHSANFADAVRLASSLTVEPASTAPTFHRSEEHTSELQSLMRISYAVFCLKKKTIIHR